MVIRVYIVTQGELDHGAKQLHPQYFSNSPRALLFNLKKIENAELFKYDRIRTLKLEYTKALKKNPGADFDIEPKIQNGLLSYILKKLEKVE